jgi:hypothetical protein
MEYDETINNANGICQLIPEGNVVRREETHLIADIYEKYILWATAPHKRTTLYGKGAPTETKDT